MVGNDSSQRSSESFVRLDREAKIYRYANKTRKVALCPGCRGDAVELSEVAICSYAIGVTSLCDRLPELSNGLWNSMIACLCNFCLPRRCDRLAFHQENKRRFAGGGRNFCLVFRRRFPHFL